jgi:hypothetical protein
MGCCLDVTSVPITYMGLRTWASVAECWSVSLWRVNDTSRCPENPPVPVLHDAGPEG